MHIQFDQQSTAGPLDHNIQESNRLAIQRIQTKSTLVGLCEYQLPMHKNLGFCDQIQRDKMKAYFPGIVNFNVLSPHLEWQQCETPPSA